MPNLMITQQVTLWTPLTWAQIYPPVEDLTTPPIFTDPKNAENLTNSDTGDSETDRPQIDFIGEYCRTCISKWSRCICKPVSDCHEYPINIILQMDSPSNKDQNDKHPLPSDWNNQENFWNSEEYEKTRSHKPKHRWMPPPQKGQWLWLEWQFVSTKLLGKGLIPGIS